MSGEDMYREHILEHYKHPRNYGKLDDADIDRREENPLCGDDIRIMANVGDADALTTIKFHGRGCAICQAAASLLTERVKGHSLDEVRKLRQDDVVALLGIPVSPVRLKCAMLALTALQDGIAERDAASGSS